MDRPAQPIHVSVVRYSVEHQVCALECQKCGIVKTWRGGTGLEELDIAWTEHIRKYDRKRIGPGAQVEEPQPITAPFFKKYGG